eukprot:491967-Prymnesium_polylepis.1
MQHAATEIRRSNQLETCAQSTNSADVVVQATDHLQCTRELGCTITHHIRKYFAATRLNRMTGKPRFMSVTIGRWSTLWLRTPRRRDTKCSV